MFAASQTLILKGLPGRATKKEVKSFVEEATPNVVRIHVKEDEFPINRQKQFSKMAFLSYNSEDEAIEAKHKLEDFATIAKTNGYALDTSSLVVKFKDPVLRRFDPFQIIFSIYVSNIGYAEDIDVRREFSRFGQLADASNNISPCRVLTSSSNPSRRYAIVSYVQLDHAHKALEAVSSNRIKLSSVNYRPTFARPIGFTQVVLNALDLLSWPVSVGQLRDLAEYVLGSPAPSDKVVVAMVRRSQGWLSLSRDGRWVGLAADAITAAPYVAGQPTCTVCMLAPSSAVLLPCNYAGICLACARQMKAVGACPECGKRVKKVAFRIYE